MQRAFRFIKGHWQLIGLTVLLYVLWDTDVVWPLRVLIVLFHELSHAVVALSTGGEVLDLTVNRREGGQVTFRGGSFIWTAMAGYLGSLFIGVFLFLMAVTMRFDRIVTAALGVIILLTTALYVRELFAVIYMSLMGVVLVGVGWKLPAQVSDLLLRVMGLVSMLYVPWDIAVDTILTANRTSLQATDAQAVAYQLGLTEKIVGVLWVIVSFGVIAMTLRIALRHPSNLTFAQVHDSR